MTEEHTQTQNPQSKAKNKTNKTPKRCLLWKCSEIAYSRDKSGWDYFDLSRRHILYGS